jgi:hypothetical protein
MHFSSEINEFTSFSPIKKADDVLRGMNPETIFSEQPDGIEDAKHVALECADAVLVPFQHILVSLLAAHFQTIWRQVFFVLNLLFETGV